MINKEYVSRAVKLYTDKSMSYAETLTKIKRAIAYTNADCTAIAACDYVTLDKDSFNNGEINIIFKFKNFEYNVTNLLKFDCYVHCCKYHISDGRKTYKTDISFNEVLDTLKYIDLNKYFKYSEV